jgi:hypothetical protein
VVLKWHVDTDIVTAPVREVCVVLEWHVNTDIVTAPARLCFVNKAPRMSSQHNEFILKTLFSCKLLHVSFLKVIFRQECMEGR